MCSILLANSQPGLERGVVRQLQSSGKTLVGFGGRMPKVVSYILVLAMSAALTCQASFGREPEGAAAAPTVEDLPLYQKLIDELGVSPKKVGEVQGETVGVEGLPLSPEEAFFLSEGNSDDGLTPHHKFNVPAGGDSH